MAPPPLFEHDDRRLHPEPSDRQQPVHVVIEAEVPGQHECAPRPAAAAPSPDETRPSMPFAPRLARKRSGFAVTGKKASRSRTGMLDAT